MCNSLNLIYYFVYLCVLIVFSLHRESLKMILVNEPPSRGGSITVGYQSNLEVTH
jgi:hypothetical protein